MPRTLLALLLASAGAAAHAQGVAAPPPDAAPPAAPKEARPQEPAPSPATTRATGAPLPRGAVLEEVSGVVREVDRKAQRIAVEAGSGRVTLSIDRNTMVYTQAGLGTVLDVVPGAQIRAGRNADFLAYWVQVRAPAGKGESSPPPGQGTGPAGGAAAPAAEPGGPVAPGPGAASPATPPGTPAGPGVAGPRSSPGGQ